MTSWRKISCVNCCGAGMVADYGLGYDFYGPKECNDCGGSGQISLSDKGALAQYPGGPFLGRLSKKELDELRV